MERLCTLNTTTLSTRTHLVPKPAQNTLSHVYRSFKVTHFGITEKSKSDCVLMYSYNNVGLQLESEISKERSEHLRFPEPHCHSTPTL